MTSAIPMPASLDAVPAAVEAELRTFFDTAVPAATEIAPVVGAAAGLVREFVLQGGKRIRPVFAFAGWRCGMTESARPDESAADGSGLDDPTVGRDASDALRVGAALELVQACALIHDDIIDHSDTRRGNPTLHRVFQSRHVEAEWAGDAAEHGVAAAILAGDLALAWADDLVHDHRPGAPTDSAEGADRRYRALPPAVGATWASMRTEVLGGQFLDIVNEASGDESAAAAYRVMEFKTAAYTVARPLELGARLAGASEPLVATLRRIGHDLGIAFQLRDDLLGVFGDPARTGKPSGDDLVSGKRTALLGTALRRADDTDPALGQRLRELIGRPLDDAELASARGILVDVGAVAEIETAIDDLLGNALAALDSADIGDDIRAELTAVAHRTAHREA